MTVTSSSLERMLALADEWIVPCMLHKCQKVLGEQLVKLKDLPTWHALVSPPPSSPQGLPGGKMAAESPNIDNLLMGFAYVASLAARCERP